MKNKIFIKMNKISCYHKKILILYKHKKVYRKPNKNLNLFTRMDENGIYREIQILGN